MFDVRQQRPARRCVRSAATAAAHASGLPPKVVPCEPGVKAAATRSVVQQRADRHPAAERLRERHHVGDGVRLLVGEERTGAADAGLDLVEDQQEVRAGRPSVAQAAQVARMRARTTPPSPWIGSTMMATVSGAIAASIAARSSKGTSRTPGSSGK